MTSGGDESGVYAVQRLVCHELTLVSSRVGPHVALVLKRLSVEDECAELGLDGFMLVSN